MYKRIIYENIDYFILKSRYFFYVNFRAVHRAFFTCDNIHIASFSDDKSVILWDIATEEKIVQFKEHNVCELYVIDNYLQIVFVHTRMI